jgi:hypothetical protein
LFPSLFDFFPSGAAFSTTRPPAGQQLSDSFFKCWLRPSCSNSFAVRSKWVVFLTEQGLAVKHKFSAAKSHLIPTGSGVKGTPSRVSVGAQRKRGARLRLPEARAGARTLTGLAIASIIACVRVSGRPDTSNAAQGLELLL